MDVEMIQRTWGWTGMVPANIVASNYFGNVIVRGQDGRFWRICPEELECLVIAESEVEFEALWKRDEFQVDWQMARLVQLAEKKLGPVSGNRCYCLKMPAMLGGKYEEENLGTISRDELVAFAGDAARQIKDVPDGERVRIVFTK